ncbi:MAG: hypothetical protein HFP81_05595 [Methylococcales symbiont of Hymedesmia sp. n. MRB-2018]|nr:MAG: hypothetical protein HFP78_00600 [Methylococcales symbiont of Hymedesmia sp. n. MRB-2018]KAF3983785.1 MAG: hypothetical protein HFP81_05595 [Methylococcales symbiont of Hymedesmia sp. n. MRB-2018]
MREYNPDPVAKKVRYTASIIYLLVLAFIVGGSYINQQDSSIENTIEEEEIIYKMDK